MKPRSKMLFLFLTPMIAVNLACAGLAATPEPSNTPLPTATATQKPTSTPIPTATEIPPTATAVPIKIPAINEQYEVTVLYARYFGKVFSGGFEYTPMTYGGKFLDIGVVVKNLQPSETLDISWEDVYIIDKNNDFWYPNFGGSYAPLNKDEKFDPATLFIYPQDVMENIVFGDIVYLRSIWATDGKKPASFLFGFDTSALVEILIQ